MNPRKDFFEIFSSQLVAITGGVIAGTLLAIFTEKLFLLPGLLVLLPGYLGLKGAIAGSLAARIGTELHTGKIKPGKDSRLIHENKMASFILVFFVSIILGVSAYLITYFLFGYNIPRLILVPMFAAIISSLILFPFTIKLAIWLYKNHHDPDNVMGPYISSIGDIESIISITLAVVILI